MMGSLPGLATGLMIMATMGLGIVGIVVHLAVAAVLGRKSPNALSTTAGPLLRLIIGMMGGSFGTSLDDFAVVIPCVGVVAWIALSTALGMRGSSS